ncbi:hypothetical protein [Acuticoccus kandeliae]|uniref:hypothetical protein n=1 Tax=Acuticoccus kandeliae TaxID=2073160 RepID=UPI000D3E754E|nr:hypothetical protein [Acuticoccus kandeliae]
MQRACRIILATLMGAVVLAPQIADAARPDTRRMTCRQVNALIQRNGAVVMTTGQYTFRRFVADRRFCDPWQWTKPEYAPTSDTPKCPVNGVCYEPPIDFHIFD